VWLVIAAWKITWDTSAFHARRADPGGAGARGMTRLLVTLLFWATRRGSWCRGRIEAACWSDVAFRVICAGDAPDHLDDAPVPRRVPGAVEALFSEVLVLVRRLGWGSWGQSRWTARRSPRTRRGGRTAARRRCGSCR